VRFQVLTAASRKMALSGVVAPFNQVEVYGSSRGTCGKLLCSVGKLLSDYMAQQPRREPSS
jgi:hypothetical protein